MRYSLPVLIYLYALLISPLVKSSEISRIAVRRTPFYNLLFCKFHLVKFTSIGEPGQNYLIYRLIPLLREKKLEVPIYQRSVRFSNTKIFHSIICFWQQKKSFSLKKCAISLALAIGLVTITPSIDPQAHTLTDWPALPDVSVLISGPPIKDPGALLRYALPIKNKAIREVQKPLEDITESLKVAGVRALDSVERVSFCN
jgi:hypothetical protein